MSLYDLNPDKFTRTDEQLARDARRDEWPKLHGDGATRTLTKKGLRIKQYLEDQLSRGHVTRQGRGWIIMGAMIGQDGHAYETLCHVGCDKPCLREDHNFGKPVDHGKVTCTEAEMAD
jgi:hypothetical protein